MKTYDKNNQYQEYVEQFENLELGEEGTFGEPEASIFDVTESDILHRYEMQRPELYGLNNDKRGGVWRQWILRKPLPIPGLVFWKGEENTELGKIQQDIATHFLRIAPWAVLIQAPVIIELSPEGQERRIDYMRRQLVEADAMNAVPQVRSLIAISSSLSSEDMLRAFLALIYEDRGRGRRDLGSKLDSRNRSVSC